MNFDKMLSVSKLTKCNLTSEVFTVYLFMYVYKSRLYFWTNCLEWMFFNDVSELVDVEWPKNLISFISNLLVRPFRLFVKPQDHIRTYFLIGLIKFSSFLLYAFCLVVTSVSLSEFSTSCEVKRHFFGNSLPDSLFRNYAPPTNSVSRILIPISDELNWI